MNFDTLFTLARNSSYNDAVKEGFKKASTKALRQIAKSLNLAPGTYDIRFNAGGIAVSGDAILHHEKFYINLNDGQFYWRTCNGRKDYTGGMNRFIAGVGAGKKTVEQVYKEILSVITVPHVN